MNALFMNSMNFENSKITDLQRLLLILPVKLKLKTSDKYVVLSNLSIHYTWENMKISYKNNKFKTSAPTWNDDFELPDWYNSVSDIQDYFEYLIKKHETFTDDNHIK